MPVPVGAAVVVVCVDVELVVLVELVLDVVATLDDDVVAVADGVLTDDTVDVGDWDAVVVVPVPVAVVELPTLHHPSLLMIKSTLPSGWLCPPALSASAAVWQNWNNEQVRSVLPPYEK